MIHKIIGLIIVSFITIWSMQTNNIISLPNSGLQSVKSYIIENNGCEKNNLDVTIVKVIDWDTLQYLCDWVKYKIRIIWIDTPETKHPKKPVQCYWTEATNKMKSLVLGKKVNIQIWKGSWNTDKYWRLLRYVKVWNMDVGWVMLRSWYAFTYNRFPHEKLKSYRIFEKTSIVNSNWLWDENNCDY